MFRLSVLFSVAGLTVFFLSTMGSAVAKAPQADRAMLAQGKKLYTTHCLSCHGATGAGDGPVGKVLNPKPRNFANAKAFKKGSKPAQIFKTLTNGLPGTMMTAFKHLAEKDRWAVTYYVKSFHDPKIKKLLP